MEKPDEQQLQNLVIMARAVWMFVVTAGRAIRGGSLYLEQTERDAKDLGVRITSTLQDLSK